MCLAIPARVVVIKASEMAVVEIAGVRRDVSLALVEAAIGDYVLLMPALPLPRVNHSTGADWVR